MSQSGSFNGTGGGSGIIETISGDIGSITGANVTIFANNATVQAGSSVLFDNLGTVSTLKVTDASANTLIGLNAGNLLTTTQNSTGVGFHALIGITSGINNTVLGSLTLPSLTTGANNTAVGAGAGGGVVSGDQNTFLGSDAGGNLLVGSANNILIGYNSGSNYTSVTGNSSNICIGNSGIGTDNKLVIGTSGSGAGQQNACFIAGITGVTAVGAPVAVKSDGQLSDLGFGTSGQVLTSNGAGVSPTWQAGGGGTSCIFSAYLSGAVSNVTGDGTFYTIVCDSVLVNVGSAYNNATGVFTAPVAGNYMFSCCIRLDGLLTEHTEGILWLSGSSKNVRYDASNFGAMSVSGIYQKSGSFLIPMSAGETMTLAVFVTNGPKVVDVVVGGGSDIWTNFSGYLIP